MTHDLDRFMNNVRVRLPGALDDAINLEMFNVLDEFCKTTNAWQELIPLSVHSGEREYEIEPEENRALIVRLLATIQGDGSNGVSYANATLPKPDLIVFATPPSDSAIYNALVSLTVIDPVNSDDNLPEFPDWFLTLYFQEFLDGVLSKMMSQIAKPYFSQTGFIYHGRRFRNFLSATRIAVDQRNTYGATSWRYPFFAPCNSR
jgi:hypothetical protein